MKRSGLQITGKALFGLTALFSAAAHAAPAYDRGNNQAVGDRPRPDYDATGMPAGGFRIFPSLSAALEHNDNIYATAENLVQPVVEDTIARIAGNIQLASGWSRHALNLSAGGGYNEFLDNSQDATSNYNLGFDGRLDIHRDWRATLGAGFSEDYEPRGRNDPIGLVDPIKFQNKTVSGGLTAELNRVRLTASGSLRDTDFDDGRLFSGAVFSQDFRDVSATDFTGRVDLALTRDTALFLSGRRDWWDFDQLDPSTNRTRDFDSTQALAGASFDITRLIRGEIGVGYFWARFDDSTAEDVDGFSMNGKIDWFPTLLTTVGFSASRNVTESGVVGVTSLTRSDYGVTIDHELRRNIIVVGDARIIEDDYNGLARDDDRTEYTAGVDWLVNRFATVNGRYTRADQDSTEVLRDYEQNVAWLGISLRR